MDAEKLKEFIKIAKEAVKNESEPYRTEGYKMILEKLLDSATETKKSSPNLGRDNRSKDIKEPIIDIKKRKEELATKCGISINELEDVITINEKDEIEIIAPITGSDAKKHIVIGLCVLAASEFILKKEWTESPRIAECLRAIGVKDLANLSSTIKKYSSLMRTAGSRGIHKKYRLTSNEGRTKAFEIIKKLAKGEDPQL